MGRVPAHRFFFAPAEVEPLAAAESPRPRRILVAGIGNIFLGDDGFGVAVARRLAERPPRPGVDAVDFGIRGMDLVFALQRGYDAALLVDAVPTGDPPGTLVVLEPGADALEASDGPQGHAMAPVSVLRLARAMGALPPRVLVVGCAPAHVPDAAADDVLVELSAPVAAAVEGALQLIDALVDSLLAEPAGGSDGAPPEALDPPAQAPPPAPHPPEP
ncbi:MAG: hydrogenase maturation protease, partial [Gemmatimonadetes bacterium]|nr:hydrogenase maturation protease [Gemmatimonadota bacterium]